MPQLPKKLKIGLVLDTSLDQPDGVQQYIISIGEWLRSQGHDVHYLVGQTARTDLPNIHSLARNINVRFNGNRTTIPLPTSRRQLRKFLSIQQFGVLHVQTPHSPFMAQRLVLAADAQTAVIGTFHIAPYSWLVSVSNKLLGIWLKPSLKRFDKIISVSPAARDFARASFGVDTEVLPNVINYDRFHGAQPLEKYADDRLTILFLGRLVPRKGAQVLLEAVAKLQNRQKLPPFKVVLCGKGPQQASLRQFINSHNLEGMVELAGFVSEADKPGYYASADIAVFPSSGGESFGIVLLEAMASGRTAVLAGDNPGYRSVMAPRPGQLFNPKDPSALADLLALYLTDSSRRQQAQHWGMAYTKDFDTAVVGAKLLQIYQQALLKRRRA